MNIPQHPDQHDEPAPTKKPLRTQTKIIIAGIATLVILMIVLHIAGIAPH